MNNGEGTLSQKLNLSSTNKHSEQKHKSKNGFVGLKLNHALHLAALVTTTTAKTGATYRYRVLLSILHCESLKIDIRRI